MYEDDVQEFDSYINSSQGNLIDDFEVDDSVSLNSKQGDDVQLYYECPEKSPLLLGPLIVHQKNTPKLRPGTEKFEQWYGHTIRNGGASAPQHCIAKQKGILLYIIHFRMSHISCERNKRNNR